jgi:hypothetical protein
MKTFLLTFEKLKDYLLHLSFPKKIFLASAISFLFTLFFVKHSFFATDIKNIFNSQTVISAINVGNVNNKVIFTSSDKEVEIENNAGWFKNKDGQIGSVIVVKDVGSIWKRKNLEAEIIGNGDLIIKLSGIYKKFSDSPTIFISYRNFTIDGEKIPIELLHDGRNDRDELIFKVPVENGQKLKISIEYINAINYFTLLKMICIALIFLPVFIVSYFLFKIFKNQNQTKIIYKITVVFFIIGGTYFILLGAFFPKQHDEFFQTLPTTAIGKNVFINNVDNLGGARFWPLGTSYYNLLRLLPYGTTSQAHYMLNVLIFVSFILLFLKILDFNLPQKNVYFYIKMFLMFCLPFIIMTDAWSGLMPFFEVIYAETLLCFLFAFFVFCYQKIMILSEAIDMQSVSSRNILSNQSSRNNFIVGDSGITLNQQRIFWAVLALAVVIFSTYCKEPVFIVFLIIACVNLLFAKRPLSFFDKFFNFVLIANAICFAIIYYSTVFLHRTQVYVYGQANINLASFQPIDILKWIDVFPILFLCAAFIIVRLYFILFKKDRHHIFYDGILFGACGYCAIIVALRLPPYGYYFLPALVLFFVVLAYWLIKFYDLKKYVIFLLISFSVFSWTMDGFVNAVDVFIKQHFIVRRKPIPYNILKLDMLSKYRKIIYGVNIIKGSYEELIFLSLIYTLEYFNSSYFHTKTLDDTEIRRVAPPLLIGEFTQSEKTIDSKNVYISSDNNLTINNKKFSDFVLGAKLTLFDGTLFYAYVHKDRL